MLDKLRRCSRCGQVKPISEFNRSSEFGYQFFCRECQSLWYRENKQDHITNVNANTRRYRERNRNVVKEYLRSHPCVDCGESDMAILEFDHVSGKVVEVSRLLASASVDRLMEEIGRCEVRCANCHARRTCEQFAWRKGGASQVA